MSLQRHNTDYNLNPIHISRYSLETLDKKILSDIYWEFVVEMSTLKNSKDGQLLSDTIIDPTKNSKELNRSIIQFLDTHLDVLRKKGEDQLMISVYELMYLTLNVTNRPTSLPRMLNLWTKLTDAFEMNQDETTGQWFSELPIQIEYEDALNTYNHYKLAAKSRPWFM